MAMQSSLSIDGGKYDDDGRIKRTGLYIFISKHQINENFLFCYFHFTHVNIIYF